MKFCHVVPTIVKSCIGLIVFSCFLKICHEYRIIRIDCQYPIPNHPSVSLINAIPVSIDRLRHVPAPLNSGRPVRCVVPLQTSAHYAFAVPSRLRWCFSRNHRTSMANWREMAWVLLVHCQFNFNSPMQWYVEKNLQAAKAQIQVCN